MNDAPLAPPDYKYWAFISYSHQDNLATRGNGSGDHIEWANWLHEHLETYFIPEGYEKRTTRSGDEMPERFFPTFRDEAELPTNHNLGGQIRDALERSRFLIVIASPRSARSRYVNEEVRYFREIGRGDRIFVLIVDGEPNVRLHPKLGWSPEDDCFCPALVHPLNPEGNVDVTRLPPEEPIAADVRVKDLEPSREMRASEQSQGNRSAMLEFMMLKLIAGLMGVGLDELVQRDRVRQLKLERQKFRRRLWMVITLALVFMACVFIAWQSYRSREFREEASYRRNWEAFEAVCSGAYRKALVLALDAHRDTPERGEPTCMLWFLLAWGQGDREELPEWSSRAEMTPYLLAPSPDDRLLALADYDRIIDSDVLGLFDWKTDQKIGKDVPLPGRATQMSFSPDGKHLAVGLNNGGILIVPVTRDGIGQSFIRLEEPLLDGQLGWREGELAVLGANTGLHCYDGSTGKLLRARATPLSDMLFITLNRDATLYLVQIPSSELQVRSVADERVVARLQWPESGPLKARFYPDDSTLILLPDQSPPRVWSWAPAHTFRLFELHTPGKIEFLPPDVPAMALGSFGDLNAQYLDFASGKRLASSDYEPSSSLLPLTPCSSHLLWEGNTLFLFPKLETNQTWPAVHIDEPVDELSLSPDGDEVVVKTKAGAIRRFAMPSLEPITADAVAISAEKGALVPVPKQSFHPKVKEDSGFAFGMEFSQSFYPAHANNFDGEPASPPLFGGRKLQAGVESEHAGYVVAVDADGWLRWCPKPPVTAPGPWIETLIESEAGFWSGLTSNGFKYEQSLMLRQRLEHRRDIQKWMDGDATLFGPAPEEHTEWALLLRWWLSPAAERAVYPLGP